ncbi:hypothetical protein BH18ACT12_BH18ACT12_05240 [soil metagenome]
MRAVVLIAVVLATLVSPEVASAHGLGAVKDLPVPLWLFYYGGAIVLVLSFAALGALWRKPRLEGHLEGRPLPERLQQFLLSRGLRAVAGTVSFALFLIVLGACFLGEQDDRVNVGPTFIWAVFWLGLVPVVVLLGNVWSVLSPWRAAADAAAWLTGRGGQNWSPAPYPERFGRWPAALLLFLFTALELAYDSPSDPATLGFAAFIYSVITWFGMYMFGREQWCRRGDAFSVYFELLSRMSPLAVRADESGRRRVVFRRPLAGLTERDAVPGTLAFVAVMLGSVGFDGLSRTARWLVWRYDVVTSGSMGDLLGMLMNLGGLIAMITLVASAYLGAIAAAQLVSGRDRPLAGLFAFSLVPIALAYNVAHYFSLLVNQGQYAIRMASDPLGHGWDLFGTADFPTKLSVLSPKTIWYAQVAALVTGHVLGLVLAHDRAISVYRSARLAMRTQYAMLALMVLYTVGGLWLLSQG